jgi:hypothetical protein
MQPLPEPDQRNGKAKLKLLQRKINGWHKRECRTPGWIYVYGFDEEIEAGRNYWKVGSTKMEDPADRVRQWHKRARLKFSILLAHGYQWAERVIHLYLWYVRMYRWPIEGLAIKESEDPKFYSVWARDLHLPPIEGERHIHAKNKQIEWFCLDLPALIVLIKAICAAAEQ